MEVIANFAPWSGVYMFHCHNLVHEDHDMMAAFNVTDVDLSNAGYPDKVSFSDPMAPLFRSKSYSGTDLGQVQSVLLPYFQNLEAYPDAQAVEKALDDYYKNPPKTSSTVASTSSTAAPSGSGTNTASSAVTVPTTLATSAKSTSTKSEDKTKTTAASATSSCTKGKNNNQC